MANQNNEADLFADYVWMGEMDKFDREMQAQMEEEFQEEEFIRSCIDQLLDEEEERETVYFQAQRNKSEDSDLREDCHRLCTDEHKYLNINRLDPNYLSRNMSNMYISRQQVPSQPTYGELIHNNQSGSLPHIQQRQQQRQHHQHQQQQQQQQQQWDQAGNTNPLSYLSSTSNTTRHQKTQKSMLNPNTSPLLMNPNAKVFVPAAQTRELQH